MPVSVMPPYPKSHNNNIIAANNNINDKKITSNVLQRVGKKALAIADKFIPKKWQNKQHTNSSSQQQQNQNEPQMKKKNRRKQRIPIALRQACWVRQFGETYQHKCFVDWCHRNISCFDFEVGHNVPESKGGTLDLDNLRPICRQCNIGMGNKYTIDEWRKLQIKH